MAFPPSKKTAAPGEQGAGPPPRFAKKGARKRGKRSAPAQKALRMGGSMRRGGGY